MLESIKRFANADDIALVHTAAKSLDIVEAWTRYCRHAAAVGTA
jgi:hypothetical protein